MKLGFIGLGLMGEAMSINLARKSGEELYISDMDKEKVKEVEKHGAIGVDNNIEVVKAADVVFISLPNSKIIDIVLEEVADHIKEGQIFLDTSTISPDDSIRFSEFVKKHNAHYLDTPLVKSRAAALAGDLGVYAAGEEESFKKIEKYLECIGSSIIYMGKNGNGSAMKICHNMLVGQIQNGVNEIVLLANELGVDLTKFKDAINIGGGKNNYLNNNMENILNNSYETAFSIENMHKDVTIGGQLVEKSKLSLPGAANVLELYNLAMEREIGNEDFSATYKIVEEQNSKE